MNLYIQVSNARTRNRNSTSYIRGTCHRGSTEERRRREGPHSVSRLMGEQERGAGTTKIPHPSERNWLGAQHSENESQARRREEDGTSTEGVERVGEDGRIQIRYPGFGERKSGT